MNVLRKHIRLLYQIHILPTIIVVRIEREWNDSDDETDNEVRDLLCNLLMDTLYKYSYNEKYLHLIRV